MKRIVMAFPSKLLLRSAIVIATIMLALACTSDEPKTNGDGKDPDKEDPGKEEPITPEPSVPTLTVKFGLTGNPSGIILAELIDVIDVFVFNDQNVLVNRQTITGSTLGGNTPSVAFNISSGAGKYQVICWGNIKDKTNPIATVGKKFEASMLGNKTLNETTMVATGFDPLFYGPSSMRKVEGGAEEYKIEQAFVEIPSTGNTDVIVNFMSAHVNIKVNLSGLTPSQQSSPLRSSSSTVKMELRNVPHYYDFNMKLMGQLITYVLEQEVDSNGNAQITFPVPVYYEPEDYPEEFPEGYPEPQLVITHNDEEKEISVPNIKDLLGPQGPETEQGSSGGGSVVIPDVSVDIEYITGVVTITLPKWTLKELGDIEGELIIPGEEEEGEED